MKLSSILLVAVAVTLMSAGSSFAGNRNTTPPVVAPPTPTPVVSQL